MNANQLVVLLFALLAISVDGWAVFALVRAPDLKYRPLWIAGSLIGFMGFGLDWSQPDHLYLEMGVTMPVVLMSVVSGHLIVKTTFPVVGAIALAELRRR